MKISEISICGYVPVHHCSQTVRENGINFVEMAYVDHQMKMSQLQRQNVNNLFLKNKFPLSHRGAESKCELTPEV